MSHLARKGCDGGGAGADGERGSSSKREALVIVTCWPMG